MSPTITLAWLGLPLTKHTRQTDRQTDRHWRSPGNTLFGEAGSLCVVVRVLVWYPVDQGLVWYPVDPGLVWGDHTV